MKSTIKLALAAELEGCVKVQLFYYTREPKHLRSRVLHSDFGLEPPFVEDIHVLLPADAAFNRLSAYEDMFRRLQFAQVLTVSDKLCNFSIRDEDTRTLAYYEVIDE